MWINSLLFTHNPILYKIELYMNIMEQELIIVHLLPRFPNVLRQSLSNRCIICCICDIYIKYYPGFPSKVFYFLFIRRFWFAYTLRDLDGYLTETRSIACKLPLLYDFMWHFSFVCLVLLCNFGVSFRNDNSGTDFLAFDSFPQPQDRLWCPQFLLFNWGREFYFQNNATRTWS
jgi:hypothetical protein